MKRGCIVISAFNCDECGTLMEHGQRYLLLSDDEDGSKKTRICTNCAENKGMASYVIEKGEQVLTFFGDEAKPRAGKVKESKGKAEKVKEEKPKETMTKGKDKKAKEAKGKAAKGEVKDKEAKVKVKEEKKKAPKAKVKSKKRK